MQFKTVKDLKGNVYSVRFETTLTAAEKELVSDFGDPTISLGGTFLGNTIAFTGTIVNNSTITQGSARGIFLDGDQNIVQRLTTVNFATGGLDGALATISALTNFTITLATNNKKLEADFPTTQTFTFSIGADIYASDIKVQSANAIGNLKANTDNFSTEEVVTQ